MSMSTRLMLPAGAHNLVLENEALAFSTRLSVQVAPGQTATAAVTIPNGSLSLNALPWAEVLVDDRSIGTTPVANVAVPIGTHEVVFRHPQHGERRRTVVVKAGSPTRVGVDFTQ